MLEGSITEKTCSSLQGKEIMQVLAKDVNLIFRTAANSALCLGSQEHPNRPVPYATAYEPYVNVSKLYAQPALQEALLEC